MKYGRFVYYQPNKLDVKDKAGDCQIRAFCKVLNMSWVEAFDLTTPICRELQTYTIFDGDLQKTKAAMKKLGFEYTGISNKKGSKRPTVDSFAKDHPEGSFIVTVANHVVAVVDGKYYDTWDSGYKSLYGYFEKVMDPQENENLHPADRLTKWNGSKWVLPQGRTSDGQSYWRIIADTLAAYENNGMTQDEIEELKKGVI